jgi:hypothetical protein
MKRHVTRQKGFYFIFIFVFQFCFRFRNVFGTYGDGFMSGKFLIDIQQGINETQSFSD